jgi:hypothetical protein
MTKIFKTERGLAVETTHQIDIPILAAAEKTFKSRWKNAEIKTKMFYSPPQEVLEKILQ